MSIGYLEILTKCSKCGKSFSRAESEKCPHKSIDGLSQRILEGKWKSEKGRERKET